MKSLTLLLTLIISAQVFALDVLPSLNMKKGDLYVKVTKDSSKGTKFEACEYGLEEYTCRTLGNVEYISDRHLNELQGQEEFEKYLSMGITVASAGTMLYASVLVTKAAIAAGLGTAAATAASGKAISATALAQSMKGTAIFVVSSSVGMINDSFFDPTFQAEQAAALRDEVIEDRTVIERDMERFVEVLESALIKFN